MIEPQFQAELRAKFNPDGSELRKIQLAMLDMLKYLDKICRDNNIQYWLSSGTCLGAVRHGGFIPWDDDLDIEMLDKDYDKLARILLESNKSNPPYIFQCQDNDSDYINDFGKLRNPSFPINEKSGIDKNFKIRGLFIDIFKLSPSNSYRLSYFCGGLRVMELSIYKWAYNRSTIAFVLRRILHKSFSAIINIFRPLSKLGAKGQLRHTLGVSFYKPRFINDIFPLYQIQFEDIIVPIPGNYEAYLRKLYGDYNKFEISSQHIKTDGN